MWVYPNIRYIPNLQFWWESIFRQIHFVLGFKILMFQILKPTMHHRIAISHPCKTAIRLKLFQIPISISGSHGKLGIYFFSKFQISPTIYVNPIKLPTGKWHFDSHGGYHLSFRIMPCDSRATWALPKSRAWDTAPSAARMLRRRWKIPPSFSFRVDYRWYWLIIDYRLIIDWLYMILIVAFLDYRLIIDVTSWKIHHL